MCHTGKHPYPDRQAAHRSCVALARKGRRQYPYLCECGAWHTTRMDEAKVRRLKESNPLTRFRKLIEMHL